MDLCDEVKWKLGSPEEKIIFKFRAFGELLFSGYFYIARINHIIDGK